MASEVDICNMALSHIGERANITAISPPDGSVNAAHCERFYPQARNEVIEAHDWGFATKRAALAPVTSDIDGFEYAYSLPSDYVAASRLLNEDSPYEFPGHTYLIEGTTLYCNVELAVLRYRYVAPITRFTPHFISAVSYLLASYLAGPVTKSVKLKTAMFDNYARMLERASSVESNASRNLPTQGGNWMPTWIAKRPG